MGFTGALLLSVALSGCTLVTPGVCPAIAWFNRATVNLTGNVDDVAALEFCIDGMCAASTDVQPLPDEPLPLTTLEPIDLQTFSPAPREASPLPTAVPPIFSFIRTNESTWRIALDMAAPETATIRALSSTGDVLVEHEVALDWRRVGGSEQCGGPSEAAPVSVEIPS
ncbi:hypothetical protein [Microterricola viridarii]|uniref:hypothetical protein n=1 Tax=Microterricola viridarii TaxID=412690 RepID=UPI0012EA1C3A|nr:hypothetical protein [Microterricola viridarii]